MTNWLSEVEKILHLDGCQQRTAGYNDAIDKKDIDTEDMERLEKLTLEEVSKLISAQLIREKLEARLVELDLLEQATNREWPHKPKHNWLYEYKMYRLADLTNQLKELEDE